MINDTGYPHRTGNECPQFAETISSLASLDSTYFTDPIKLGPPNLKAASKTARIGGGNLLP